MAPSFDCAVLSLLCAEDNAVFCDENDDVAEYGSATTTYDTSYSSSSWSSSHGSHRRSLNAHKNRGFFADDSAALPLLQSDDVLGSMVEKESHHSPASDYSKRLKSGDLDLLSRSLAVDWISKANAHFGFGPLCSFLSINYLDRFLSAYELPKGKSWTMQLLAVACLSLGAKVEETDVPLSLDLQVGDSKFVFQARTVQRMELLVLSTLKWKMQAITPFNFIDHFLNKIINGSDGDDNDHNHHQIPLRALIQRSSQLILMLLKGIDFLEFKPSEIAAAVAISVASETKTVDTEKAIPLLIQQHHLEKERVVKCAQLVKSIALINGPVDSAQSVPQSPIGVLNATACLSYKSDDTTTVVGSCSSSASDNTHNKRRKLSRPFDVEL